MDRELVGKLVVRLELGVEVLVDRLDDVLVVGMVGRADLLGDVARGFEESLLGTPSFGGKAELEAVLGRVVVSLEGLDEAREGVELEVVYSFQVFVLSVITPITTPSIF